MVLVCSNCGKREGTPTATYCRDCYTVFPFEARRKAQSRPDRQRSIAAWKLVPIFALVAGGFVFTQIDFGKPPAAGETEAVQPEPSVSETRHRSAGNIDGGVTDGAAFSTLKDRAPKSVHRPGRRLTGGKGLSVDLDKYTIAPSITVASQYVGWVLGSDKELACPSIRPCPATIAFGSGERGKYAVERWEGTSNNVVPVDARASILLNLNNAGRMNMKLPGGKVRSVDLEKRSSRWAFSGTGGA